MGSCVSADKNPDSSLKIGFQTDSKSQNLIVPTPTNGKPINGDGPSADLDSKSKKSGTLLDSNTTKPNIDSKEETFFDSQAWLESDCEDDFLSVNGDHTPSCGSTPRSQRSASGAPRHNEGFTMVRLSHSKSEASSNDKKMRLSDLFKESLQDDQIANYQNISSGKLAVNRIHIETCPKSSDTTPFASQANSNFSNERTPNIDIKGEEEKTLKAVQCCLPGFFHSLSFNERKKQLSPRHQKVTI